MASLHVSFFQGPGSDGVGRGKEAGLRLGSLQNSFLGSWVGWVGRFQEAGLPLGSLYVSFFLGSWVGWVPGSDGWAAAKKLGLVGLPSCFLFSGSWLGRGGPRQRSWAPVGFPSYFLSGLLGRMGGPRPRSWAPVAVPSCFLLSGSWVGWVGRSKEAGLPLDSLHISFLRS